MLPDGLELTDFAGMAVCSFFAAVKKGEIPSDSKIILGELLEDLNGDPDVDCLVAAVAILPSNKYKILDVFQSRTLSEQKAKEA